MAAGMDKVDFPGGWFRGDAEPDPMHAAQKGLKAELPLRFYKEVAVVERAQPPGLELGLDPGKRFGMELGKAFAIALDGRMARTPARRPLAVPSPALAELMAAEWRSQGERIDPASMPVTRLVNSALDGVAQNREAVAAEIVNYAGCDLLCYRAEEPEKLARRQQEAWDPLLAWAAESLGAPLTRASGILHTTQPRASLAAVREALERSDAVELAALNVVTTLTGSAILALAVAKGRLEPEAAWAAAHVDEDFQAGIWGADEEAAARRAGRWRDMEAASRVLALTRTTSL